MANAIANIQDEFQRHKKMADQAVAQLSDEEFFRRPGESVNSVAIIIKHLAGNLSSRWTDFLTSDGEKPNRDRDGEFLLTEEDSRGKLLEAWEQGWKTLFAALGSLSDSDFDKSVSIRAEKHTVLQATLRGLTHATYHVGQILYLARLMRPQSPWLTVAPGQSKTHSGKYLKPLK